MSRTNIIGVAVMDAISGPLKHYPERGKTPQVVTENVTFQPGGGAVNTAATLAHLGMDVALFTKVGDDTNGRMILDTLDGYGVDVSGVRVAKGEQTPFTFVGVHEDGQRTFIHTPGTNLTFSRDDIDESRLCNCEYFLYQDLFVLPLLDGEPGTWLLRLARRSGAVTLLDECWGLGPKRELLEEMAPEANYLLPSIDDLALLYGTTDPVELAAVLFDAGARDIVAKCGSKGCVVCTSKKNTPVAAEPANVVDTTGAGDAFDAGFIAGLAHGLDVAAAARHAAKVAAARIAVTGGSTPVEATDILPEDG